MATFAFSSGVTATTGWGDRWLMAFTGTYVFGDTWSLDGSFQGQPFTIGSGNSQQGSGVTFAFTYNNRVYLANGQVFNFSDNGIPTAWEDQNPGAGFINYLSRLGAQDAVQGFGQIQGRLAVFGRRSVQMWNTDADPANFGIAQQLDNIGTQWPLSIQNLGDFDVLFLDDTGVRSLRTREVTLNAYVDDVGSAVDSFVADSVLYTNSLTSATVGSSGGTGYTVGDVLVVTGGTNQNPSLVTVITAPAGVVATVALLSGGNYSVLPTTTDNAVTGGTGTGCKLNLVYGANNVAPCAIVEPVTKNYWLSLNGVIYVLSRHVSSKISAWTTFVPNSGYVNGNVPKTFNPQKFVVLNGLVYCRSAEGWFFVYGGDAGTTYDTAAQVRFQLPWLEDKKPALKKQAEAIDFVLAGAWNLYFGMDPSNTPSDLVYPGGSATTPDSLLDSTYDIGTIEVVGTGTHFSLVGVSANQSTTTPAVFSSLVFHFNKQNVA